MGESSGGWFVRITILVVVLIWLIPVVGVLVTSFRSEQLANTTGWWEALGDPFKDGQWTLDNYQQALDAGGFQNAFLNSLAVTIPSTIIPITIAAFAAYAFSWMQFRGRDMLFVIVVGLMVVPLQMALIPTLRLYAGGAELFGVQVLPDLDLNGTFLGLWLAHTGVRPPAGHLPAAQLHRVAAVIDHRVGQDRRRRPLHDLLAAGRAAVGPGARPPSPSSSSSGCGTTCWSPTCSSGAPRTTRS